MDIGIPAGRSAQPPPVLPVLRHDLRHHVPEIFGMVHVGQVAELMDHHVIQYHGRGEYEPVVEGQGAPGGTAPPAGLLVPHRDGGVMASGEPVVVRRPALELRPGGLPVSFFQGFQPPDFRGSEVSFLCGHL